MKLIKEILLKMLILLIHSSIYNYQITERVNFTSGKKELGFVEVILVMDFMRMESNRQKNY